MLPGRPGGGRTPEGVRPRVNTTRCDTGSEIHRSVVRDPAGLKQRPDDCCG